MSVGNRPEDLSQRILVGMILVDRFGVTPQAAGVPDLLLPASAGAPRYK